MRRTTWYFGWIAGVAAVIATVLPLTLDVPFASRIATAMINLSVALAIGILTSSGARAARRDREPWPPTFEDQDLEEKAPDVPPIRDQRHAGGSR
ncbi:hypothetical protein [Fodinicola acaciae]|uniref:hypothetical protein n=1 Tax=Fodinicola acaciae TaxID=2681555 RepID=UPI0013D8B024|nr:hypothetical protein [Fodinicola acaciae]